MAEQQKCHYCGDPQYRSSVRRTIRFGLIPVCKFHADVNMSRVEKLEYQLRKTQRSLTYHQQAIDKDTATIARLERKLYAAKHFGARRLTERLKRIREFDVDRFIELEKTIVTFVECGFSKAECARRLFTHRNTLVYRLEKAADLCGVHTLEVKDYIDLYIEIRTGQPITPIV